MSASAKTPAATCAHWYRKEAREARRTVRRERRRNDRAVLRDLMKGDDFDAALFSTDLGTEGRLSH